MAVIYTFTVNDPNNVGPFPPSVTGSAWASSVMTFLEANAANKGNVAIITFADTDAANSFVSTYALTDPTLLADIAAWKSAHSVSYTTSWSIETPISLPSVIS